jgi:anti-sigma factor RsiW
MKITKDVIMDLLPLYLAGEASADTRRLVESYLAEDASLARAVSEQRAQEPTRLSATISPDSELRALLETRKRLRLRSWIVGLAICLTLFPLSVSFGPHGMRWAWADMPAVAITMGAAAIGLWIAYFRLRRQGKLVGV